MIKNNKKIRNTIIGVSVFCLLYIIFALRPLGTELHLTPEWTEDVSRIRPAKEDDELIPFRLGQNIGFFTPDGRVVSRISYSFKATISSEAYATYGASNNETVFYDKHGTEIGTITEPGFPFFEEDRIFNFLPGGTSFARCASDGSVLWQYENYAPITAFASSAAGVVAGFADGSITSFDENGNVNQNFSPLGSEIPVILGVGISSDGKTVACVSGRNKQRFVIAEKNGEHSKTIFYEYLPKDFTSQVLVKFNKANDMVFFNYNGGLGIVDLKRLKSSHIPLEGHIVQIEESVDAGLVFVLSKNDSSYTVTVVEPFDHPAGSFTFDASCAFIQVRNNALFVGCDNKISRLTLSRK